MTGPIYLSLVFHNHQPVGQLDHVSEHITHVSYLPLIEALERYPDVRCALHYSGALLDWLKQRHIEIVERLKALVVRDQVELLSGGYYEPPLCILPDEDKLGQIDKLTEELESTFGTRATGLWLAERIWEPHLARPIAQAGIHYVIVDDTHFEIVGFDRDKDLFGYYVTEEQGHRICVFPTLTTLRYSIPWEPVETLLEWLREQATGRHENQQPRLALMGDNGEKFGTWPGSYEHCWGDGKYIDELFTALQMNGEWLKTITPGDYMRQFSPLGRAYLPAASYMEMGTWSLMPDESSRLTDLRRKMERERRHDATRFLNGGFWRNFLVKYDEINHLHKRTLLVSGKVHAMRRGRKRDRALDLLWAAQGNDPYWHGRYGGAYLFNIRVANYANLIAAEDAAEADERRLNLTRTDFDCDKHDDLVLTGFPLNAIWKPNRGGALVELDYRPAAYNLYNVMTRRKEGYHNDLIRAANEGTIITPTMPEPDPPHPRFLRAKEAGLERLLIVDWHRRASFLDHFIGPSTTLEEFYRAQYAEQGDFIDQPYRIADTFCNGMLAKIILEREGRVWVGDSERRLHVQKAFNFKIEDSTMNVEYVLTPLGDVPFDVRLGIETVVGFDGGNDLVNSSLRINKDYARLPLGENREFEAITHYSADTNLHNLTLRTELSRAAFLWQFPLETITLSEAGFERGYQGTTFLHVWSLRLVPGQRWSVSINQTIQQTASRP